MTKSVVSGVAGSARILRLAGHELAKAEDHGKRLDHTGKMRQVREASPITTSGLDLVALREAHVAGAMVPRGKTAALHMLVQFPTELLNEPNPEWMLKHARAFAETVFGKRAIFADRVDRDEAGLHVVDLFLAPRYFKKTKHVEQEAVSISKHMKDLAINQGLLEAYNERNGKKNGKKADAPNLWMQGRALQTALHEYLRDVVGLAGVKRGSPKRLVGNDWMPAEQLDIERRQEAVAAAEIKVAEAGREASAKLSEAEELRQVILAEKQAATTAMQHAEALQRGMLAFASGEIVGANERSGKQVLSFRDVETKEKVYPLVLPAFDAVWRFVVKAMDRIRDMLKSAAEDKEQAAKIRLQADQEATEKRQAADAAATKVFEDAQQAAGHLLTEAAAMNDAALLEKKKAKEATDAANMARLAAAAERSALQDERLDQERAEEETLNSLRLQHDNIQRAKAEFSLAQTQIAARMTSEAIQKAAEALVTPQEVQRAAERLITPDAILAAVTAKVTSDDVLKAAQRSVTVELVEDVIAKRVSAAQAARMTQGRDLGR